MAILFARATLPGWVIILAIGAFFAPAGIAMTVLLVALGIACLPVSITGGVWKRTSTGGLDASGCRDAAAVYAIERPAAIGDRETRTIDAEFTVEDAAPVDRQR